MASIPSIMRIPPPRKKLKPFALPGIREARPGDKKRKW